MQPKILLHKKYQTITIITQLIEKYTNILDNNPEMDIIEWYRRLKTGILRNTKRYSTGHNHYMKKAISKKQDKIKTVELDDSIESSHKKTQLKQLNWELDQLFKQDQKFSSIKGRTTHADTTEAMTKTFFRGIQPRKS